MMNTEQPRVGEEAQETEVDIEDEEEGETEMDFEVEKESLFLEKMLENT